MMSKRFLVPVLALIGCGLPASASIVEYCSGTSSSCATDNLAAFNNAVTTDNYSLQALQAFSTTNGVLSGDMYTDDATGIEFVDIQGNALTLSGGVLSTPLSDDSIEVIIPAAYLVISLSVDVTKGLCNLTPCEGETTGFVGFINTGSPTSPWIIGVSPAGSQGFVEIDSASAGGLGGSSSPTPEVATFVLIGFGLIAMRWMRRLPRRFFRTLQPAH